MNTKIIWVIVLAIVIVGASFYGGMSYSKGKVADRQGGMPSGQFGEETAVTGKSGSQTGGFTIGQIISNDATGRTIKMQDGSTKIILTSSSTQIMKMIDGTQDDLSVGTDVTVMGAKNNDGSITAQSIQIRSTDSNQSAIPTQTAQ
ncbi:MAG: hypothetical protein NTY93_01815 [Candidatus Kaiserbacteria bacterium]|nr:hypothetical protein [Candidatus Kaiserbacteria bacterium]